MFLRSCKISQGCWSAYITSVVVWRQGLPCQLPVLSTWGQTSRSQLVGIQEVSCLVRSLLGDSVWLLLHFVPSRFTLPVKSLGKPSHSCFFFIVDRSIRLCYCKVDFLSGLQIRTLWWPNEQKFGFLRDMWIIQFMCVFLLKYHLTLSHLIAANEWCIQEIFTGGYINHIWASSVAITLGGCLSFKQLISNESLEQFNHPIMVETCFLLFSPSFQLVSHQIMLIVSLHFVSEQQSKGRHLCNTLPFTSDE